MRDAGLLKSIKEKILAFVSEFDPANTENVWLVQGPRTRHRGVEAVRYYSNLGSVNTEAT
jgi:hypothetical protein